MVLVKDEESHLDEEEKIQASLSYYLYIKFFYR